MAIRNDYAEKTGNGESSAFAWRFILRGNNVKVRGTAGGPAELHSGLKTIRD
jgi:hypothetical protein